MHKLAGVLKDVSGGKGTTERFRLEGSEPMPATPQEFSAMVAKELVDTARLMRELNVPNE